MGVSRVGEVRVGEVRVGEVRVGEARVGVTAAEEGVFIFLFRCDWASMIFIEDWDDKDGIKGGVFISLTSSSSVSVAIEIKYLISVIRWRFKVVTTPINHSLFFVVSFMGFMSLIK